MNTKLMMNNKKEYIAPSIETVGISYTHIILAASDHHTRDNFSKQNNLFMDETDTDDGNVFSDKKTE
jgi:hypothetical protein